MYREALISIVCVGGLFVALSTTVLNDQGANSGEFVETSFTQLSVKQLHTLAESITVKVLSGEFLGSGILIDQQGSVYTVLTNAHILRSAEPPYQIQTPDGQIYQADVPQNVSFPGHDLALLQFQSPDGRYPVASLGTSPRVGGEVFAAGFPFVDDLSQVPVIRDKQGGFVLQVGQVSLILEKALEGGYRIGYTNPVEKGMSGGPLLNNRGQVVGINGMHAEPLWGDPYIYMDGSIPEPDLREQMSHYSWGIPIDAFVQFAPPAFIPRSRNNLPSHNRGKNSDHQPDSLPDFLGIFPNLSPTRFGKIPDTLCFMKFTGF